MQGAITIRGRVEAARAEGRMLLGGHRGNPAEQPENTLASFRSAIELGCDMVECDVHLTADGELAVIHDHLLERTTNGAGLVGTHTLAELRELDAGGGERIPLLEEVIALCRDQVGLVIETKQNPIPYAGLEEKLVATLRRERVLDQVTVISFHHGSIRHLKELAPELDAGIVDASRPVDPVAMLRAARADLFSSYWGTLEPAMVAEIREAGYGVGVWTVDDDLGVMWMQACRPDSVFTNRPREIGPKLR
jgi:glycerophosphoryl diester phosphodiesterase